MTTNSSGNRKNSKKTSIIGTACSHAAKDLRSCVMERPVDGSGGSVSETGSCRAGARQDLKIISGGDEFIPLADHVVVFVHDGVPAGDRTHAVFIGTAVALGAGLFENSAVRRLDVVDRGLAFHPVAPFV